MQNFEVIEYDKKFEKEYIKVHNDSFADSCYSEVGWKLKLDSFPKDVSKIFLALKEGVVIGEITLSNEEYGKDKFCIDSVSVLPEHRKRGVGSLLIKKAVEYAETNNKKVVCEILDSCDFLLKLYQKQGFKVKFLRYRINTKEKSYKFLTMKEVLNLKVPINKFFTWIILQK